jgi:hypothetical protein
MKKASFLHVSFDYLFSFFDVATRKPPHGKISPGLFSSFEDEKK